MSSDTAISVNGKDGVIRSIYVSITVPALGVKGSEGFVPRGAPAAENVEFAPQSPYCNRTVVPEYVTPESADGVHR